MKSIFKKFDVNGEILSCTSYGNGQINDTFLVKTIVNNKNKNYIMQRINHRVFKDIDGLMNNIAVVTSYIRKTYPNSTVQKTITTKDNKNYYFDKENYTYWRVFTFVENGLTLETITNPDQFYETGVAFGFFQEQLRGFDASLLVETIKDFHHTKNRYKSFLKTVRLDLMDRAKDVKEEIEFIRSRRKYANVIVDLLDQGLIPYRVTHNDSKLNNVLFHKVTYKALAVVDLDTIMPGSVLYDFGDAIRYGANTGLEDDKDLSRIGLDLELFESFTNGFLKHTASFMNEYELENLGFSAILITYELALRFLEDYLNGDNYFKTKYKDHNLQRARAQMALVEDMESKLDEMNDIIKKYCEKTNECKIKEFN